MPNPSAINAHRQWWRQNRPARVAREEFVPIIIRHGKDDEIGSLAYAARIHGPQDQIARAFASAGTVEKAISDGRWITLHPNGKDEAGHPVLIKDNPDGTATIVGGIGGKLNGFRMSLVRSEDDYKAEIASRGKEERARLKAEKEAIIAAQGAEEYNRHQEELAFDKEQRKAKKLEAAEHLARTVLTAQGINADSVLEVPDEVMAAAKSPKQAERIKEAHVLGVAKHARQVAQEVRQRVVTALEAQQPVEGVAFADIVREALSGKTPGYAVNPERIAVSRGIAPSPESIGDIREQSFLLRADNDEALAAQRMASVAKLQAGAASARAAIKDALEASAVHGAGPHALGGMNAKPVDVENAGAILAAANAYREASRSKPPAGMRSVAPVTFHPDHEGEDIPVQSLMDELRTRAVSKLVDISNKEEAAGNSLYSHISSGRYAELAGITGQLLPGATVDPALVDFLGSEGASHLVALAALETVGQEGLAKYRDGLVQSHLDRQVAQCDKAVDDASVLMNRAGAPLSFDADNAQSMIATWGAIAERNQLLSTAREHLGKARGRLEATASAIKAIDGVLINPDRGLSVTVPGSYKQVATMAAVMLPGLELGRDYTLVSPESNLMALDITADGVRKLASSSGLSISDDVAKRLEVVRQSANTSGKLPLGLRREIDAKGPVHGAATTEYGELSDKEHAMIRSYWCESQGIEAAQECDPFGVLKPDQEPVWRRYQDAVNNGNEVEMMQSDLAGRFDALSKLDLDDNKAVIGFGSRMADILGLDVVADANGNPISIPQLDARKTEYNKARFMRPRIIKFMRTFWAATQGADYFDPANIKPVSKAWASFVQRSGGDMAAVASVQDQMKQDPDVMVMQGKPLRLTDGQERMIGMIIGNRRMAAGLGAGAGKTLVMMGSFAQLRNDGQAQRALIAVPSAVVGQFESEWNKFVDPQYGMTMHAATGNAAKTSEAMGGAADFVVMTHEGLRKRLLDACADEMGTTSDRAGDALLNMPPAEVDQVLHKAMHRNNWDFDYVAYDEGHKTLGRAGKEESLLSTLLDSAARLRTQDGKLPYYVFATADPAKNDVSELHSLLGKIDPERFTPENRDQFVRSYGRNTEDCAVALRNMMSPYIYTQPAEVPVKQTRDDVIVPLTEEERQTHDSIQQAYQAARLGRAMGTPNVEAEKILGATNPKALALSRDNAISRALLWSPSSSKANWVRKKLQQEQGRGTVIFARNRASVEALKKILESDGHRVDTLTGADSGVGKRKKREAFQNEEHDILICTDAAEAGMNLQRGNLMINFDVPMTAKTLEQRIARQVRMGQQRDVDVFNLVSDCHWDRRNLQRLKGKGTLREIITSPFELSDDTGRVEERVRTEAGV